MNKYTMRSLVNEAAQGRKVIVLAYSARDAHTTHMMVTTEQPAPETHSRANGFNKSTYPSGGSIDIKASLTALRGQTADIVFIDSGVDAKLTLSDYDDIRATIATSPTGEIIRA